MGKALTPQKTRMLLALRINVLAKGYSGISLRTLKQLIDAFNGKIIQWFLLKVINRTAFAIALLSRITRRPFEGRPIF